MATARPSNRATNQTASNPDKFSKGKLPLFLMITGNYYYNRFAHAAQQKAAKERKGKKSEEKYPAHPALSPLGWLCGFCAAFFREPAANWP
jgi:hypothetical protein